MEPEKDGFQKESPFPGVHVSFRGSQNFQESLKPQPSSLTPNARARGTRAILGFLGKGTETWQRRWAP